MFVYRAQQGADLRAPRLTSRDSGRTHSASSGMGPGGTLREPMRCSVTKFVLGLAAPSGAAVAAPAREENAL